MFKALRGGGVCRNRVVPFERGIPMGSWRVQRVLFGVNTGYPRFGEALNPKA